MGRAFVLIALVFGALLAPVAQASILDAPTLRCGTVRGSPPCGPIPAIITIILDKSKGLTFTDNKFETDGRVQYYFDIDQDGYAYDPTTDMKITIKVNKQAPWIRTTVDPTEITVPIRADQCPECIKQDGAPDQWKFEFEHPIKVTVDKVRDPTPEELVKWTKSDGTYRASLTAYSNDSMAGTDETGRPAGITEGYAIKELRFLSSAEAVPEADAGKDVGLAPGPGLALFVLGLVAALAIVARRREE